ncbi:hypothetical protein ACFWOY_34565 [Streptomyces sp. NPDC058423]|uniref:hypothetical protein n=1 Tax=unclassified Streptomyces TaxID=2593676 RepID=UPI00364B1CA5
MWWNFIGRSHDDMVRARNDWAEASDRFCLPLNCPMRRPHPVATRPILIHGMEVAMNDQRLPPVVGRRDDPGDYEILIAASASA